MANTSKKYYWLKLKEDFFDDDTIEWIEDQPNGSTYALFYLKLCLKSLKTNGILIRNVGDMLIPYDAKKLGEITRTDSDTVRVAMDLFQKIGLIQILENGEIFLSQLEDMVGSESKWAEKKRLQRAKKAEALPVPEDAKKEGEDIVLNVSEKSPREIEKEIEIEKELEIEKEIDKEIDKELTDRQTERVDLLRDLFAGWPVSDLQIFYISSLINDKIPCGACGLNERDLKIYDYLQNLIYRAKADNVQNIYRWLIKVIPAIHVDV